MPKESPTASSLRAGPANPGSRAGWAPPNPPGPRWGLCSPAPSPRDPLHPGVPVPGAGRELWAGFGNRCCPRSRGQGGRGHDASLPGLCLLVASGETPGCCRVLRGALPLQTPCTAPGSCSGSKATPCPQPQTHPGAGTPEELGMPRRRWARGGCGRRCQGSFRGGLGFPEPCREAALWFQLGFPFGNAWGPQAGCPPTTNTIPLLHPQHWEGNPRRVLRVATGT